METYDIIMLVVLVGATLFGAIKGFAWQLASIGSIVVSYMVAYNFREPFSQSIRAEPPWNRFLAMLILYVGTSLVIWVAFRMVSRTIDRLKLREFDRQVGALFGLAKGVLYCTLITLFAVTLLGDLTRQKIVASKSGRYISRVLDRSEAVIPADIHDVVQPYLEKFDRQFDGQGEDNGLVPDWDGQGFPTSLPSVFSDSGESSETNPAFIDPAVGAQGGYRTYDPSGLSPLPMNANPMPAPFPGQSVSPVPSAGPIPSAGVGPSGGPVPSVGPVQSPPTWAQPWTPNASAVNPQQASQPSWSGYQR